MVKLNGPQYGREGFFTNSIKFRDRMQKALDKGKISKEEYDEAMAVHMTGRSLSLSDTQSNYWLTGVYDHKNSNEGTGSTIYLSLNDLYSESYGFSVIAHELRHSERTDNGFSDGWSRFGGVDNDFMRIVNEEDADNASLKVITEMLDFVKNNPNATINDIIKNVISSSYSFTESERKAYKKRVKQLKKDGFHDDH